MNLSVRTIVATGALAGAGALVGVPISGLVGDPAPVIVAAVVAVAAAATTCVVATWTDRSAWRHTARWRRSAVLAGVGAAGAAISATVVAAVWRGPVGTRRSPVVAMVDGAIRGWSEMATSPVPADVGPMLLVPLALLVWGSTASAVVLLVRRRTPIAPLLPGTIAILVASVAAGAHQSAPVPMGLGLVAAAAVVLVVAPTSGAWHAPRRSVVVAVVAVAITTTAVGVVVGPRSTLGRDAAPFDLRDRLDPPVVPESAVNPIELAAGWLRRDDVVMFTVRSDTPVSTRLVALDAFDGTRWSSSATYERTGSVLPEPDGVGVTPGPGAAGVVSAEIELGALPGPWLPSITGATRIAGGPLLIEPNGRAVLADGDRPQRYTVEASPPDFAAADLRARLRDLPAAHDETTRVASAALPSPPDWVREVADEATGGTGAPYVQAVLLERYLRTNFRLSDEPVAGHSYGHLARSLLSDPGDDAAAPAASSEQLASMFAVVGRILGLPTRVVVGFSPGDEVAPGTYDVKGSHVVVWPEVRFAEVGWVPFDPTPATTGAIGAGEGDDVGVGTPELSPDGQVVDDPGDIPDPATVTDDPASADDPALDPGDRDRSGAGLSAPAGVADADATSRWSVAAAAVLLVVSAVVAPLAAIVAIKRRATRRRRAVADSTDRVLGAWHDVHDRLLELGVELADSSTVTEIVERSGARSGALTGLYRPVSKALYGDEPVTVDDAEQAWRARDRFVETCRREGSWRRRLRWRVDPRPVFHRRPGSPGTFRGPSSERSSVPPRPPRR